MAAVWVIGSLAASGAVAQSPSSGHPAYRARLSAPRMHVYAGTPVWVDFSIANETDEPVLLSVPNAEVVPPGLTMGLPIDHVFSGLGLRGLAIRDDNGRTWDVPKGFHRPDAVPVVRLGPRSSVGVRVDLHKFFPVLRSPGTYRLKWSPYGGRAESNPLVIKVGALQQARIITDVGEMVVRFYYEEAPRHVDNFVQLARDKFYDGLTFHRIESGYFLQGGCPNGDGTGIRPDGVRIPAEFTNRPHRRGSVSMALLDDDPDSASCQFFITNTDVPEWTGRYTIFGRLEGEESFKTLDRLMQTEVDKNGRPLEKLVIRSIRISDLPRPIAESATNTR